MALHLEDDAVAIVDVNHAGVFAGALNDARTCCRQGLQPLLGRLVGAVLVPHGREDAKLGKAGLPSDQVEDTLVFVGLQPVGCNEFRGDLDGVWNRHRSHAVRAEESFRFFSARGSMARQENALFCRLIGGLCRYSLAAHGLRANVHRVMPRSHIRRSHYRAGGGGRRRHASVPRGWRGLKS
ncbi:hypothetical protein D3C71_1138010 [compost metagenome]